MKYLNIVSRLEPCCEQASHPALAIEANEEFFPFIPLLIPEMIE